MDGYTKRLKHLMNSFFLLYSYVRKTLAEPKYKTFTLELISFRSKDYTILQTLDTDMMKICVY